MDNKLLVTWIIFVVFALIVDIAAYIALRVVWKKKGVVLTDQFWDLVGGGLNRVIQAAMEHIRRLRLRLPQAPGPVPVLMRSQPASATSPTPAPAEVPDAVEIIPAYVTSVDEIRHVQFSFEMALNTKVSVHIGATPEAGVRVEKREL